MAPLVIDTSIYEHIHGRKPRGNFIYDFRLTIPYSDRDTTYRTYYSHHSTYTVAKRAALKEAHRVNAISISLEPNPLYCALYLKKRGYSHRSFFGHN